MARTGRHGRFAQTGTKVMTKTVRRILIIGSLLALVVTVVVVISLRRDADALGVDWRIKKQLPTKEVEVEPPTLRNIVQTVTAPGTIELIEEAKIASQVVGQVTNVNVEKGDTVKKGDLLVKLDDEDALARLASTDARIDRLKAGIQLADADLKKALRDSAGYEKLSQRGFSTPTEVLDGKTTVEKMQAALEMSRQELKESYATKRSSEQLLEWTEIRAPIDGTVIELDVEVGEVVIAGTTNLPGTVLLTIGNMNQMRVRADVDEMDVGLVRPDQEAKIYLQADQADPVPGTVDLISPKGTRAAEVVSFETLITVDGQHDSIRPEMTATVEIAVKTANDAVSVPVQAVVHRRMKDLPDTDLFHDWIASQPATPAEKGRDVETRYVKVVFIMRDGIARAQPVETGISDPEFIEILAGVSLQDKIIYGPFRALDEMTDGQPVKLAEPKKRSGSAPSPTSKKRTPAARIRRKSGR